MTGIGQGFSKFRPEIGVGDSDEGFGALSVIFAEKVGHSVFGDNSIGPKVGHGDKLSRFELRNYA